MRIIADARSLRLYPVGMPGFTGGTEQMVHHICHGLAKNHTVHVVTPDLMEMEQRGETEFWWPGDHHPKAADAVVMFHSLEFVADYAADYLILATNGIDPDLGPGHGHASGVDAFPIFSQKHGELMLKARPTIKPEQLHLTGLGIDFDNEYSLAVQDKVPGRLLYANDPARGLWHVLDIYDKLRELSSTYTLHVAYDFDRQFEHHKWSATGISQVLWSCKKRLAETDGVVNLGGLSRQELVREQLECQIHVMPSDPPNMGSQIHGITQMECAAAGAALVLADYEAFPEVFGDVAMILPQIGEWLPRSERRYDAQDWAEAIDDLRFDPDKLEDMVRKGRKLASENTWSHVVERWEQMLGVLAGELQSV